MTKQKDKQGNHKKTKYTLLYGGAGLFTALVLIYVILSFYYSNHFFKNTFVNGVDASNKTVEQTEEAINAETKSYILTLVERNDHTEQIFGDDIDLHTVFDGSLETILEQQNGFFWPIEFFKKTQLEIGTMLEYDFALLEKHFKELDCFNESFVIEPTNAYISEYGENGYEIIPEDQGALVNEALLFEVVKEAINSLTPSVTLEEAECYEEAEINFQNERLVKAAEEMNKIAGATITYEFGDDTEILDGEQINEWLTVDDNYEVSMSTEGVKEFVDYIGSTYNSFGRVRTFKTSYGPTLQISGGDYGWWMDRVTETEELTELILAGETLVRDPAYFQTAQQYGDDDIGNTYVEVNLTAQHLFFYKEGTLIVEADFVSGNLSRNYGTPTGTYPIQYKQNDATLTGEDYSTPVKYWMPFNGNIGFHDASWRKDFGKYIYFTNGSHGCINMPPQAAKTMFENIQRGVAVVVYELSGTENYDIEEANKVLESIRARRAAEAAAKAEAEAAAAAQAAEEEAQAQEEQQ